MISEAAYFIAVKRNFAAGCALDDWLRAEEAVREMLQSGGANVTKGTSGEDIGRPGPWGEGRYQQPGESVDKSVRSPPGKAPASHTPVSTPVTQEDYKTRGETLERNDKPASLGGDAG